MITQFVKSQAFAEQFVPFIVETLPKNFSRAEMVQEVKNIYSVPCHENLHFLHTV